MHGSKRGGWRNRHRHCALPLPNADAQGEAEALLVLVSPVFAKQYKQIADLAAQSRLPTMFGFVGGAQASGLMAYGVHSVAIWRRVADYVDKILKGSKPGDLPVEQPTKCTLVINLKTAQALGLTMPPPLLFQADEVIK
jgi:putative tryptophan/tyrosine transport system substrate-binding protein